MSVSLTKGNKIDLAKTAADAGNAMLTDVFIGLGWDVADGGAALDLDAVVVGRGKDGKAVSEKYLVFYNNLASANGEIVHQGDNLTGVGDGDDEQVKVNLSALPAEVDALDVWVTIHEAAQRGQSFSNVNGAFVRAVDASNDHELAKYDLSGASVPGAEVLHFATVSRKDNGWELAAVGEGATGGLQSVISRYGL